MSSFFIDPGLYKQGSSFSHQHYPSLLFPADTITTTEKAVTNSLIYRNHSSPFYPPLVPVMAGRADFEFFSVMAINHL